tara:strand:+ start:2889 stop:3275 length:387 start_codon:yes stop_codon:yes gene_type:complete
MNSVPPVNPAPMMKPPQVNPESILKSTNPNITPQVLSNSVSSSFLGLELSFPMKVILCLVIMLILHFLYKYIRNNFFGKSVSFDEDDEVLRDMEDMDDDDYEGMDDEYFDENEEYEMEKELEKDINKE